MTFSQLHDGFYRNPKVRKAGHSAAWLWVASIGYASEGLTDGFVPSHDLSLIASDIEGKALTKAVAKLVEVGLWEVAEGGWRVHDYLKWNFSKSAVLAKREATLARVNKHRNGPRHGEGNAVVMRSNASSNAGCNAVTAPVTNGVRNTTSSDPTSSEGSKEPLSPAPKAPTTGTPLELTPPKEKAPRKATKPPADPPPFDPLAAYEAIASTAAGRFAVGQKSEWDGGHVIRARVLIRKFPDLATWSLVGAWLASGVMSFRGTLSVGWVAKSFAESVTLARDWDAKGRPAGGANRAPDPYAPKPAPVARVVTPSTVNADLDAYMAGMEKKR